MDILDIDEVLKDDSFIFLEDKTHDDVSNILQQWKSNNCLQVQSSQPQQEQAAYKLNSRTFTRPKRKSTKNLESHKPNALHTNGPQLNQPQQQHQPQTNTPMLNLEIGGLVTTMHKSFLQDTSPPSSICSSMNASLDRMNNSLITSADFSNINFLQSTQSLVFNNDMNSLGHGRIFNLTDKSTSDGYTLSDMIRDREALESLTMSGDGTLIKDSHIAQIDDISLALSKTASGCSTMDNSTESVVDDNNRTVAFENKDTTYEKVSNGGLGGMSEYTSIVHHTMLLSDEMIGDTTFNLVENSICVESETAECAAGENKKTPTEPMLNTTSIVSSNVQLAANETFNKLIKMNETMCLTTAAEGNMANSTYDCQQLTPDARCETPENNPITFYESTPQTINMRNNKQHYTPIIKMVDDVNLSPIVAATRVLNETFEHNQCDVHLINDSKKKVNSETFSGALANFETMELLENIENPNEAYSQSYQRSTQQQAAADIEMQNVMDLAQAEAELLASNDDEEEFEHMLEEFSKVELNAEQLKMKRSLETIKKRFNAHSQICEQEDVLCVEGESENSSGSQLNATIEMKNSGAERSQESLKESPRESRKLKTSFIKDSVTNTSELRNSALLNSRELLRDLQDSSTNGFSSSTMSSASSNGERLLSRRSRLYDDINMSALSMQCKSPAMSFTVHKHDSGDDESENATKKESEMDTIANNKDHIMQKTGSSELVAAATTPLEESANVQRTNTATYKLTEKRERDRDRFKTIKIVRERSVNGEKSVAETELNVPCIDDDDDLEIMKSGAQNGTQRISRRDHISSNIFNNNKSEVEEKPSKSISSKINMNFLTYKKPKDKTQPSPVCNLPEVEVPTANASKTIAKSRLEPRSFSRPRYISGLQKFNVVKATSASDLEKTTTTQAKQFNYKSNNFAANIDAATSAKFNRTQPNVAPSEQVSVVLKSPMGTKSKSFHNLSSNFGYTAAAPSSGLQAPRRIVPKEGLKKEIKVNSTRTNSMAISSVQQQQEAAGGSVFKVPNLVSRTRALGATGLKRAGLVRPSSGYYSLNVTAKGLPQANDIDAEAGRHSPTDSMSSASSRGSVQSGSGLKSIAVPTTNGPTIAINITLPQTLTKITTGSTGIPKPSGLRPLNVMRSGLPKPATNAKR